MSSKKMNIASTVSHGTWYIMHILVHLNTAVDYWLIRVAIMLSSNVLSENIL